MAETDFDVVIAGGGVPGLSLAARLGQAGFRVALIAAETVAQAWPESSIDLRVYAISRGSEALLRQLGAWSEIAPRACAYRDMRVWDAQGHGTIHFNSAELGEAALGHIIEARVIAGALLRVIGECDAVTLLSPAVLQRFSPPGGDWRDVILEDGRGVRARLLVGADGKHSRVRDQAGLHARASDYGQQALVAVVECARGHQETAWQRFLPTGPLAFLPLHDGRCSIVWSATTAEAQRLQALDDTAFRAELAVAFEHRLGEVVSVGERVLFPLSRQYAERTVAPRLALIGDASHVIHPLAGQGVNLGLKDVRALAGVLIEARAQRRDIGSLSVLRRYERARRGDILATLWLMDAFKQLFGSRLAPLRWLRNTGLNLVDAAAPAKNRIMRAAMDL